MTDDKQPYEPPMLVQLGSLAELTQDKEVGAFDGMTFLGIEIGS